MTFDAVELPTGRILSEPDWSGPTTNSKWGVSDTVVGETGGSWVVREASWNGDVPALEADSLNAPLHARTALTIGDGDYLRGYYATSTVGIDSVSTEATRGVRYDDRVAAYVGGNGTDTLTFEYVVEVGDRSDDLDATSLDVGDGAAVVSAESRVPAATHELPSRGVAARYSGGRGSALAFNKALVIDTQSPLVVELRSITPDGTYGVGQLVYIGVRFDAPVAVRGSPVLWLEVRGEVGARRRLVGGSSGNAVREGRARRSGRRHHDSAESC